MEGRNNSEQNKNNNQIKLVFIWIGIGITLICAIVCLIDVAVTLFQPSLWNTITGFFALFVAAILLYFLFLKEKETRLQIKGVPSQAAEKSNVANEGAVNENVSESPDKSDSIKIIFSKIFGWLMMIVHVFGTFLCLSAASSIMSCLESGNCNDGWGWGFVFGIIGEFGSMFYFGIPAWVLKHLAKNGKTMGKSLKYLFIACFVLEAISVVAFILPYKIHGKM